MQQNIISNVALRNALPAEQARQMRSALAHADSELLSDHLIHSLDVGAIPPSAYRIFLDVSHDASRVVDGLRQDISVRARRVAILRFGQRIRTHHFTSTWEAVGRAAGLCDLMATMSVNEVRLFCSTIRKSRAARSSLAERQAAVTELYEVLSTPSRNPDKRPLGEIYEQLIVACTDTVFLSKMPENYKADEQTLCAHTEVLESRCLARVFPEDDAQSEDLSLYKCLVHGRIEFAFELLERFSKSPRQLKANARFFERDLALPLARRLARRREPVEVQSRFYDLILECFKIEPKLCASGKRLVFQAIEAWRHVPSETKHILGQQISHLIRLLPKNGKIGEYEIHDSVGRVHRRKRIAILKLLLPGLSWRDDGQVDVESQSNHEYLRSFGSYWDSRLLLSLPSAFSVNFFEVLEAAWPASEIAVGLDHENVHSLGSIGTICTMGYLTTEADRHILWTVLQARNHKTPDAEAKFRQRLDTLMENYRSRAAAQPDPRVRTLHAVAVMHLGIASGSLDRLRDTLLWLRRFNRDAETVLWLYNHYRMNSAELLDLLSGFPVNSTSGSRVDTDTLTNNIQKSTSIQLLLLETMSQCAREPGFKQKSAQCVLSLPRAVVERRALLASRYYHSTNNDKTWDETLYNSVYTTTISGLLELESHMHISNPKDPVFFPPSSSTSTSYPAPSHSGGFLADDDDGFSKFEPHTQAQTGEFFRFLDDLARERDSLWVRLREGKKNGTSGNILGDGAGPWPKGLPVQSLVPLRLVDDLLKGKDNNNNNREKRVLAARNMPYFLERVRDIVFMPQEVARKELPGEGDKELRRAIGRFVDSYPYAFQVYSALGCCSAAAATSKEEEDQERMKAYWYAVNLLGSSVGSEEALEGSDLKEAIRCCDRQGVSPPKERRREILGEVRVVPLPGEDGSVPLEWNPVRARREEGSRWRRVTASSNRQGPISCIGYMMTSGLSVRYAFVSGGALPPREDLPDATKGDLFSAEADAWPGATKDSLLKIWGSSLTRKSLSRLTVAERDSIMGEIMLRLNALEGADSSFLTKPFPESHDGRFPGLLLHEESSVRMESLGIELSDDLLSIDPDILQILLPSIPPLALQQLAKSILTKVESDGGDGKGVSGLKLGMKLIKLLIKGDRPSLASPLIQHVVTERRDDSSWHRVLLNAGTLQRLPAKDAAQLFHDISATIKSKIAAQKASSIESPEKKPGGIRQSPPAVKVSTFKMIAQLISKGLFVDSVSARKVLSDMLDTDPHPDVRIAIAQGLMETMKGTDDAELKRNIMDQMAAHIVPMAALINERKPMVSKDWEQDVENAELPTPEPDFGVPPLLQLLVDIKVKEQDKRLWVELILLPALEKSTDIHTVWLQQLARRHNLEQDIFSANIPRAPVHVDFLYQIYARYPAYLPHPATFNTVTALHTLQTNPNQPPALTGAIEKLSQDASIRDSHPEILKHLRNLTSPQLRPIVPSQLFTLADILRETHYQDHHHSSSDGPSSVPDTLIQSIQTYLSTQLTTYLTSDPVPPSSATGTTTYPAIDQYNNLHSYLSSPPRPAPRIITEKEEQQREEDPISRIFRLNCLPILEGSLRKLHTLAEAPSYAEAPSSDQRWPRRLPDIHTKALSLFFGRFVCSRVVDDGTKMEIGRFDRNVKSIGDWAGELRSLLAEFAEDTSKGYWWDRIGVVRSTARDWGGREMMMMAGKKTKKGKKDYAELGIALGGDLKEKIFNGRFGGKDMNRPSMAQMLMVDQAEWLICESDDPDEDEGGGDGAVVVVGKLRDMAREWKACPNEWIEGKGVRILEALEKWDGRAYARGRGGRRGERVLPEWLGRYADDARGTQ